TLGPERFDPHGGTILADRALPVRPLSWQGRGGLASHDAHVYPVEPSAIEASTIDFAFVQHGLAQVRAGEVCAPQVGLLEVCTGEVSPRKLSAAQVRLLEVGAGEIRLGEVSAAQICLLEVALREHHAARPQAP